MVQLCRIPRKSGDAAPSQRARHDTTYCRHAKSGRNRTARLRRRDGIREEWQACRHARTSIRESTHTLPFSHPWTQLPTYDQYLFAAAKMHCRVHMLICSNGHPSIGIFRRPGKSMGYYPLALLRRPGESILPTLSRPRPSSPILGLTDMGDNLNLPAQVVPGPIQPALDTKS